MKTGHYINKKEKLQKSLDKYLSGLENSLIFEYGGEKAQAIIGTSKSSYPDIIPYIPFFNTPMYDSLGYSLRQTSTIDSGTCTFCFSKKGDVEWPEQIRAILN